MVFPAVAAVTSWAIFFPPATLQWILCSLSALNLFLCSAVTCLKFAAFHMIERLNATSYKKFKMKNVGNLTSQPRCRI